MAFHRTRVCGRLRLSTLLLIVFLSAIIIFFLNQSSSHKTKGITENDILNPQYLKLQLYRQKLASKYRFDKDDKKAPIQLCKVPKLSLNPDMNQFPLHKMEPLQCTQTFVSDLFYLEDYTLKIIPGVLNNRKLQRCIYKAIEWKDDDIHQFSAVLERNASESFELKLKNEFFHVECFLEKNTTEGEELSSLESELLLDKDNIMYPGGIRRLLKSNDQPLHQEKWNVASDMNIGEVVHGGNQRAKKVRDIVRHVQDNQQNQHSADHQAVMAGVEGRSQLTALPYQTLQQNWLTVGIKLKPTVGAEAYDEVQPRYIGSVGLPDSSLIDRHAQKVYHRQRERMVNVSAARGFNQQYQQQPQQSPFINKGMIQHLQRQRQVAQSQGPAQSTQVPISDHNKKIIFAQGQRIINQSNGNKQQYESYQGHGVNQEKSSRINLKESDFDGKRPVVPEHNVQQLNPVVKASVNHGVEEESIFLGKHAKPTVSLPEGNAGRESTSKGVANDEASENESSINRGDAFTDSYLYMNQLRMESDFEQFFVHLVPKEEVLTRIKDLGTVVSERMNVLIFAMDSMSHLSYQREMPKTYEYIKKVLNAVVLNSYNIVGDATTAAIIPITTGLTEMELPEVRKGKKGSTFVDTYPLIWNRFEQSGYVTLFTEDKPDISTFNLRFNGFEEIPVDHYMRPFYQALFASTLSEYSKKHCTGSQPTHRYMLKYLRQLFERYPRNVSKFAFAFLNDLSHDDNDFAEYIDGDLVAMLEGLRLEGHLRNTVIILMADHGARYSKVRLTTQGKLEERLPMMSFAFPDWFQKKYPNLMENLKTNADRLTTPFDIHATLLSILNLKSLARPPKKRAHGLSLLRVHPLDRTCADAGVDAHWCACMDWQPVDPTNWRVLVAAKNLVQQLNFLTRLHRDSCAELRLKVVLDAKIGLPNEKVLKYLHSVDPDQRVANISGKLTSDLFYLQLVTETLPGNALFEATVTISNKGTKYQVIPGISRINRYGSQAHCIMAEQTDLRKFCYCKEPPPSSAPRKTMKKNTNRRLKKPEGT